MSSYLAAVSDITTSQHKTTSTNTDLRCVFPHSYSSCDILKTGHKVAVQKVTPILGTINPSAPCVPLVPSSELGEAFRPDDINKSLAGLGGAPSPDSSGKIKDK